MPTTTSSTSFWIAFILALGALVFYVGNAFFLRSKNRETQNTLFDFNLGLPRFGNNESLFAITLVAAGTSLSTVFVFFLTAGTIYGAWIFLCPAFFAVGNYVMFLVYRRTSSNGYFDETKAAVAGGTGLLPFLAQRLTGSRGVGWLLVAMSLVNLLAVLVLELIVGVDVIGYLAQNTLHVRLSSGGEFTIFACSIALLLAYVFIGGFRAVVASDVWQMRAMKLAIVLALVSVIAFALVFNTTPVAYANWAKSPSPLILWTFVLNIVLGNVLIPFAQESSWQRFRAFGQCSDFDMKKAITKSLVTAVALWSGLIILAFVLQALLPKEKLATLISMSSVLDALRTLNASWFPLVVFPIMTVAALSAMYSTADTCVSAVLYLVGYSRYARTETQPLERPTRLPAGYYIAMLLILALSLSAYAVVRIWFTPTILQLVFSVYTNLIVVAPTVLTTTLLRPSPESGPSVGRAGSVAASLILGTVVFWGTNGAAIALGEKYLWLSQLSLTLGLIGAVLPLLPVWIGANHSPDKSHGNPAESDRR